MRCNYCGKFVGHAPWCREPKSTAVLTYGGTLVLTMPIPYEDEIRRLCSKVEALEWLLEVNEITWADMDAMSMKGFREFHEIRRKALRDAGKGWGMDCYDIDSLGHALGMMAVELVKVGQDSAIECEQKRLAAVRELTKIAVDPMARLHDIEKTVQALAAVWPEAVEGVR